MLPPDGPHAPDNLKTVSRFVTRTRNRRRPCAHHRARCRELVRVHPTPVAISVPAPANVPARGGLGSVDRDVADAKRAQQRPAAACSCAEESDVGPLAPVRAPRHASLDEAAPPETEKNLQDGAARTPALVEDVAKARPVAEAPQLDPHGRAVRTVLVRGHVAHVGAPAARVDAALEPRAFSAPNRRRILIAILARAGRDRARAAVRGVRRRLRG